MSINSTTPPTSKCCFTSDSTFAEYIESQYLIKPNTSRYVILVLLLVVYFYYLYLFIQFFYYINSSNYTVLYTLLIVYVFSIYLLIKLTLIDPGYVSPLFTSSTSNIKHSNRPDYCDTCQLSRPLGSHHCKHCRTCIYLMDHHCQFISNCVSLSTLKPFICYTLTTVLLTVIFLIYSILYYMKLLSTFNRFTLPWEAMDFLPLFIYSITNFIAIVACYGCTILSYNMIQNSINSQTSIDIVKKSGRINKNNFIKIIQFAVLNFIPPYFNKSIDQLKNSR